MLVEHRRYLWRRFLPGGVVLEALLVVVTDSPRRVSASAPVFASFHLHRPGRTWSSVSLRWRMLCRRSGLADALPPSSRWLKFVLGGCFAAVVDCSGGCFATFVRSSAFAVWTLLFVLAGLVAGLWVGVWVVLLVVSMLLCCYSCCRFVF